MSGDDLLDGRVSGVERGDGVGFGYLLSARFHHHDPVHAAGDDEIERALFSLRERWIDDELPVDHPDAHAGNRLLERNARQGKRGGGAGNGEHVGVVLGVGRKQQRDHLCFVPPAGANSGRMGRSISRLVSTSFSVGLPSRLKKPPGMRPEAYVYSR